MNKINIAIDGYSGTGKSSTAKSVANALNYTYIDSGAMYRATTLFFLRKKVDWSDLNQIKLTLEELKLNFLGSEIILNSEDVSDEIRSMKVNEAVSHVAAIKIVRLEMVRQQQQMGAKKGVVMDGRDIGTVVFPLAELKIFMIANAEVRALRRQSELSENGVVEELYVVKSNLLERDRIDSSRLESPLVKADDAIEMDTSNLSFDEQVRKIVEMAKTKINES
ncbi:MAG: cytidylate kinase [Cyclobacteriaceae bacterium]